MCAGLEWFGFVGLFVGFGVSVRRVGNERVNGMRGFFLIDRANG